MEYSTDNPMIVMNEHGFFRLTPEFLGSRVDAIREAINGQPPIIDAVLRSPYGPEQVRVGVARSGGSNVAFSALPYVNIRTAWALSTDGQHVVPDFATSRGGAVQDFKWSPDHDLFRLVIVTKDMGNEYKAFFALVSRSTNATYHLPLPNINGNGLICLGAALPNESLFIAHAHALNLFHDSVWNNDWYDEWKQRSSPRIFAFTMGDEQTQLAPAELAAVAGYNPDVPETATTAFCRKFSNNAFDFLLYAGL